MSRRQYPFHLIEPKWQQHWAAEQTFRAWNPGESVPEAHPFAARHGLSGKVAATQLPPKFYILDMFPYPSGAGLHVGHPEGYTATDILARYRRAQGFNVLHPMGWDSFGLPAEQYAVKTGQHPRVTTEANIANFTRQIKSLGFSYDWTRELATTDPDYFKWTQWIFLKLYNSYFDKHWNKAMPISLLEDAMSDSPKEITLWENNRILSELHDFVKSQAIEERDAVRRHFIDGPPGEGYRGCRLAYVSEQPVWWCEQLGTVLANEEVIDGKSEVGGFPAVRKPMRQWMLRITSFAERLLQDLNTIDWSDSLKEMQRNWIGRSEGAHVTFQVPNQFGFALLEVFTTRPDTLFGATYMVLAPEHHYLATWIFDGTLPGNWPNDTPDSWKAGAATPLEAIEKYQAFAAKKSDLERTELAKDKTGVFTGVYAVNPVNGKKIPVWIADYVLASYGTGAIMAVPAHDTRDFEFAKKFNLPVIQVVQPTDSKADWQGFTDDGVSVNSGFITGLSTPEAKAKISAWLEEKVLGKKTINYKLRDWLFSRQRYWGEPFPIVWKKDATGNLYHEALPESALPLLPPTLEDYKPTADGQPPLARAKDWLTLPDGSTRETNTMPQWAGSCWYYLRYLDAKNGASFVGNDAERYWMGGTEVRGQKSEVRSQTTDNTPALTSDLCPLTSASGVDLYVGGTEHAVLHLLYARFWHKVLFDLGHVSTPEPFFKLVNQGLILGEDGQKMSKSRGNVVNPDDVLVEFGADAFRLYEMFMGPLQDTKPWNTRGVEGVYRFLGRVWRLFVDEQSETEFEQAETTTDAQQHAELLKLIKLNVAIKDVAATPAQLKTLHTCIKKVTEDLDGLRFNTAISAMMVFVNDAMTWETKPVSALKTFAQLLAPFAPHIAEELWAMLHSAFRVPHSALTYAPWPKFDAALLVESELEIPVSVNGKLRDVIKVSATATQAEMESAALATDKIKAALEGKTVKKIIVVPKKMVNIVAG